MTLSFRKNNWSPEKWTNALVWQTCLRKLARRSWGTKELDHELLQRYQIPAHLRETAILRLIELHFLNDEEYTAQLVRSFERKGFGPLRMKQELKKKHIDEQLITKYIEPTYAHEEEEVQLIAKKKWEKLPLSIDIEKRRSKLYRFLIMRGFSSQAALSALQSL